MTVILLVLASSLLMQYMADKIRNDTGTDEVMCLNMNSTSMLPCLMQRLLVSLAKKSRSHFLQRLIDLFDLTR